MMAEDALKVSDAKSKEYEVGVHTANFLEAVKANVEEGYKPQNWDLNLGFNPFEDKSGPDMVKEYEKSGHSSPFSLILLLERVNNSYPDKDERPDFVKVIVKELGDKIAVEN